MKTIIFSTLFLVFTGAQAANINVFCMKEDLDDCRASFSEVLTELNCAVVDAFVDCPLVAPHNGSEVFLCSAKLVEGCRPSIIDRNGMVSCEDGAQPRYITYKDLDLLAVWDINRPASICAID